MLTAATAFYIAFAELFNDTVKKDVLPLGTFTWLTNLLHSSAVPYDVQRTEPRGFGTTGVEQRTVSRWSLHGAEVPAPQWQLATKPSGPALDLVHAANRPIAAA